MIPELVDGLLPTGVHNAAWNEIETAFALTARRKVQLQGLYELSVNLGGAGCTQIWLDGSFVTDKVRPGDYDACWDWVGVDPAKVDPLLLNYPATRARAKAKYLGDIFLAGIEAGSGLAFVDFFQQARDGRAKGIIRFNPGEIQ